MTTLEKLEFKVLILAPVEKVWDILWNDKTYRQWTAVFSPDSQAESDWREGSEIRFLDGKGNGMRSLIENRTDYKEMTFRHLAEIHEGKELSGKWSDAIERYTLKTENGNTEVKVELDSPSEFKNYFSETFPKALLKVKELSESF